MTTIPSILKTKASQELEEAIQKELEIEDPEVAEAHLILSSGATSDKP